jgi:hypothetical protein
MIHELVGNPVESSHCPFFHFLVAANHAFLHLLVASHYSSWLLFLDYLSFVSEMLIAGFFP